MADQNLFEQLKEVLADFKQFLDDNVPVIKPAIQALASLIPQINDLLDLLVDLLTKVKTEIQNLDVGSIPGLEEVSQFTSQIPAILDAAKKLLPGEADTIGQIADVTDVVTGLPSVDAVKAEIITLVDAIVAHLNGLKA